ncbi:putative site-specific DNA-methyltransferase [Crocosphaera subtropica ATCC 51142]|uniref:Cytosine-specific methyltransferase n=1 Tax=Crocosphaera subtropica (strain ATCC 51142 / BH68) TaxID=43989 RepID=B1WUK5_CROS5|nr:DNA (cytosine-5-)-methyltransferase [Crocosphaera subtropica]ACB53859.1 putative site-specific DNA-methyltransferase [Crocosphaera subtropica ATCC 51142]
MKKKTLKFIDLFAGIGGFRLAFEKAGYHCVYSCEINDHCRQVYYDNFGELPDQDITKIIPKNIPDFDILTAGFPCQPFSICGKREGFKDTRGTLFFHICEIIEVKKPKVIVLENVKHLIHHQQGKTLETIIYALEDLGYLVDYKLLNAKDFGVPQNRERIIIIGTLNKKFNFDLIDIQKNVPSLRSFLDQKGNFEYLDPKEYTLIQEPKKQLSGLIFIGYRNKNIWKKGIRPNTEHLSRVHRQPNRIYSIDGVHPTLPSQETSGRFFIYIPEENAVRKLTLKECYRIMGFPDDFIIHSSTAEAYKQIGNSICVPLFKEVAIQLKEQIFQQEQSQDISFQKNIDQFNCKSLNLQLEITGMTIMNHREKLLELYDLSAEVSNIQDLIPSNYIDYINVIATNCKKQKGVYTVLITLLTHKILNPNQDIRYHQKNLPGGFSGRTIDTQYITPTLKELGLPAMAESGWLTRSLEQPYPYTLDYNGNISNKKVKEAFLNLIDFVETYPNNTEIILKILFSEVRKITEANKIKIIKLNNPEKFDIATIVNCLDYHFNFNYKTHGASKLPVLAFYAIYQQLIQEVERYKSCQLNPLGSHTASDRTSKTAGDIEIIGNRKTLLEVIEIKQGKPIDLQIIRIAKDKIIKFNPRRYCIFSSANIKVEQSELIEQEIKKIRETHGCQIIVNGIIPTLKYYLRLLTSVENFINNYSNLVESDPELQAIHKIKWNEILFQLEI